jgi:hypothetical protein
MSFGISEASEISHAARRAGVDMPKLMYNCDTPSGFLIIATRPDIAIESSFFCRPSNYPHARIVQRPAARRLLPGRCLAFPFIFEAENPAKSPLLIASPLLECRFFPPNPYLWSRFCLLVLGPSPAPRSRPDRSLAGALSTSTLWNSSSSLSSRTLPVS